MRLGLNQPASGSAVARNRLNRAFPRAAAALAALFGLLALGGWLFGVERLRAPSAAVGEIKANTALALILAAISLWFLASRKAGGRRRRSLALACAAGTGLVGTATLVEYLSGLSLGVDGLLVADDVSSSHAGRPVVGSALSLAILGLALLILDARSAVCRALVQALAVTAILSSLLAILAACYTGGMSSSEAKLGLIPPNAAVAFLLLALGVLAARPDLALVRLVRGSMSGSVMARRLLPVALVALPILGWLRLQGEAAGLYGNQAGVAVHSTSLLVVLAGMVLWTSRALNQVDCERRERALHSERLAAIVESSHDAIIAKDTEGVITSWNRAAERMYGHTAQEVIGRSIEVIIPDERRDEMYDILSRVLSGECIDELATERVTRDGRAISVSLSVSPVRSDGRIVGASVVARDISERRRAEEAVAESNRRFQALAENIREVFWITSADIREVIYLSPAFERIFGLNPETLAEDPNSWRDVIHPEDRVPFGESIERLAAGEAGEFEYRIVRPDGEVRWIHTRGTLVRDADGVPYQAVGSSDDVTARRLAAQETLAARAEAERANRAKSDFLSRMSHELRTPLNAVLGFAQLLQLDELEEQQSESVELILKGGRHLLSLIDEVLDISRIETGKLTLSVEPVDAQGLLEDVLALVKPTAAERAVSLAMECGEGAGPYVLADLQRLKQVLLNLLSNAIKYNRDGGRVTVSQEEVAGDRLRILVSDTGPGIPEHELERLFAPFDRLGAERTEVPGTGLGLALSKRLTEAMGGTLTVESKPGRGSTFCVELALTVPHQQAESAPFADFSERAPTNGSGSGSQPGRRSLLYIEDNAANFKLIEKLFARDPEVEVSLAMQGELGIELARQHRPDLVLLDLHLPDIPGSDVLTRLKGDPRTADVPVIVLSADASPRQTERLCDAGAWAYVTKPLDVESFFTTVRDCLDRAGAASP